MVRDRETWLVCPDGLAFEVESALHNAGMIPDDQHEAYLIAWAEVKEVFAATPSHKAPE